MQVLDLVVRDSVAVSANATRLVLAASDASLLPAVLPGQFVEVRIDATPGVLLRRPISIHDYDAAGGILVLLVQRVGKGTAWLCSRKAGDVVNVVLPLGNGFTLPQKTSGFRPLLIGGGVGVAPLLLLGKELTRRGAEPTFLLGARTENDLLCLERFEQAARTLVSTENGGAGEKGLVTQHSVLGNEH
ncbi:MAG: dihydroorotate dehydrogenase electron transfer subunit, partial [Bacteroidaceae bacterium]|nr:dihydroorotate dehydrogenase electron transfer subunit [Bacteroidaceae bacterium]